MPVQSKTELIFFRDIWYVMGNKWTAPCDGKDAGDACEVKEDDRIENATYTCQALDDDDKDKLTCSVNACTAGFKLNTARDACVEVASDLDSSTDPVPKYTFTADRDIQGHDRSGRQDVSLEDCKKECDKDVGCGGISYNSRTKRCVLKNSSVLTATTFKDKTGYTFYKKSTPGSTESYMARRTMPVEPTGFSLNSRGFASIAEF